MGSSDFGTILGLGIIGVGGYVFITQIWPMLKGQLQDAYAPPAREEPEEERQIPLTIVEDRYPDVVLEDRTPDYIIEDRYPDYVPYYPIVFPPNCPTGRYWDGIRCKKIDCPHGYKWDDGRCRIDCPPGFRYSNGICKPRNCDDDEFFDGRRCRKLPESEPPDRDRDWWRKWFGREGRDWKKKKFKQVRCPSGYYNDNGECKKRSPDTEKRWGGNPRDRWHEDRDVEEKVKEAIGAATKPTTPETDRVKEITEKAVQSFIEVDYF